MMTAGGRPILDCVSDPVISVGKVDGTATDSLGSAIELVVTTISPHLLYATCGKQPKE